jgi:hypothetical protein
VTQTVRIASGCGGLATVVAWELGTNAPVNLILDGRWPPVDRRRSQVAALERQNGRASRQADVSAAGAVRRGLAEARGRPGPLDGPPHGAGLVGRKKLFDPAPGDLQKVLDPRVRAVQALDEVLGGKPLQVVCHLFSMSAASGDCGACDCRAASAPS